MLTSIFSSDFLVVVNSVFRKGEPVDRHRGDNQASVIIIFIGKNESAAIVALASLQVSLYLWDVWYYSSGKLLIFRL